MADKSKLRALDQFDVTTQGRAFETFQPTTNDLMALASLFYEDVKDGSPPNTVQSLIEYNPEILIAFRNKTSDELGFVALLPLTTAGHIALADDRLDTISPQLDYICKPDEQPHSVYVWAIGVSPKTSGGIAHVMEVLRTPRFAHCTLYCSAANKKAERLFLKLGFTNGAMINGSWRPALMEFPRLAPVSLVRGAEGNQTRNRPLYDTYDPDGAGPKSIGIKLVHNSEELMQVFMIRGAAYLGEQAVPWGEDVDGNDYCAAHLVGYIGTEPAACMRVRFFSNFVKLERLAVLPHFRKSSIAARMVKAGIEYAKAKGYSRFYGHSEEETSAIWRRFGFVPRTKIGMQYQTERKYYEGDMVTDNAMDAINPNSGPYVLLRPEGRWHVPSALEPESEPAE